MSHPLVVGLGQATVAISGVVSALPDHGSPVEMQTVTVQVGGAATTALLTASELGCRTRLCTKIADDFLAPFITNALARAGIESMVVRQEGTRLSSFCFEAMARGSGKRACFTTEGDVGPLRPDEVDIDALLADADALLIDGFFSAAQRKVAEVAAQRNIPVILDYASLRGGIGELAALSDVMLASERLASELAPQGELQDSLVELQRLGPGAVILTLGEAGSIGLHGDQLVEQPAFEVDAVDAQGAGNVYHGAFVTALLSQLPFPRCMEFASAAAALSCREFGSAAGIPTRDEVIDLVRSPG